MRTKFVVLFFAIGTCLLRSPESRAMPMYGNNFGQTSVTGGMVVRLLPKGEISITIVGDQVDWLDPRMGNQGWHCSGGICEFSFRPIQRLPNKQRTRFDPLEIYKDQLFVNAWDRGPGRKFNNSAWGYQTLEEDLLQYLVRPQDHRKWGYWVLDDQSRRVFRCERDSGLQDSRMSGIACRADPATFFRHK